MLGVGLGNPHPAQRNATQRGGITTLQSRWYRLRRARVAPQSIHDLWYQNSVNKIVGQGDDNIARIEGAEGGVLPIVLSVLSFYRLKYNRCGYYYIHIAWLTVTDDTPRRYRIRYVNTLWRAFVFTRTPTLTPAACRLLRLMRVDCVEELSNLLFPMLACRKMTLHMIITLKKKKTSPSPRFLFHIRLSIIISESL